MNLELKMGSRHTQHALLNLNGRDGGLQDHVLDVRWVRSPHRRTGIDQELNVEPWSVMSGQHQPTHQANQHSIEPRQRESSTYHCCRGGKPTNTPQKPRQREHSHTIVGEKDAVWVRGRA